MPTFSIVGGSGPASNLCLESLKDSTIDGAQLAMATCDGGDKQQFRVQPWPPLEDRVSSAPL